MSSIVGGFHQRFGGGGVAAFVMASLRENMTQDAPPPPSNLW